MAEPADLLHVGIVAARWTYGHDDTIPLAADVNAAPGDAGGAIAPPCGTIDEHAHVDGQRVDRRVTWGCQVRTMAGSAASGGIVGRDHVSLNREAHRVYDLHVRPIEQTHMGEYALVTPDREVLFAPTLVDIMKLGQQQASRDNFIFKVGDVALGKVR